MKERRPMRRSRDWDAAAFDWCDVEWFEHVSGVYCLLGVYHVPECVESLAAKRERNELLARLFSCSGQSQPVANIRG